MLGLLYSVLAVSYVAAAPTTKSVDLLMPGVQPQTPDTYLCRSLNVAQLKLYITGFIPNANKDIAHHILLYGCDKPGSKKEIWNCGEMASIKSDYEVGPVCKSGSKILYAWAMDAPSLSLPDDVAFRVGKGTDIKTLAMQVHYKNVASFLPTHNKTDRSGLTLVTTDQPKSRLAGVYLLLTGGDIPAGQIEYLETACRMEDMPDEVEIHPFAFRTHTHTLGRVVSGYRVRNGQWTEIGRHDPRKPQMFYNVTTRGITVKEGDILAARCTMENNKNHTVYVGATQNDEMCNFYIMYYVNGNKLPDADDCYSEGGPRWYLKDYDDPRGLNLAAMPVTASVVPGTTTPLLATTPGAQEEIQAGRQDEEKRAEVMEEEEEGDPFDDELFDELLSNMSPREVSALVNEVRAEQRYPYPAMPMDPRQMNMDEAYNPYYYPDGDDI